jgi:hypothetical protein
MQEFHLHEKIHAHKRKSALIYADEICRFYQNQITFPTKKESRQAWRDLVGLFLVSPDDGSLFFGLIPADVIINCWDHKPLDEVLYFCIL